MSGTADVLQSLVEYSQPSLCSGAHTPDLASGTLRLERHRSRLLPGHARALALLEEGGRALPAAADGRLEFRGWRSRELAPSIEDVKIPQFRGHPKWRDSAPGVHHGKAETATGATSVHSRVQGRRSPALSSR